MCRPQTVSDVTGSTYSPRVSPGIARVCARLSSELLGGGFQDVQRGLSATARSLEEGLTLTFLVNAFRFKLCESILPIPRHASVNTYSSLHMLIRVVKRKASRMECRRHVGVAHQVLPPRRIDVRSTRHFERSEKSPPHQPWLGRGRSLTSFEMTDRAIFPVPAFACGKADRKLSPKRKSGVQPPLHPASRSVSLRDTSPESRWRRSSYGACSHTGSRRSSARACRSRPS